MKIEGNKIIADASKLLARDGVYSNCIYLGINDSIDNWIEVDASDYPEYVTYSYDELVEQKIRQRYTISSEFAVLRQKDEKPTEYTEYYAYCEQCKAEAKAELGIQ